MFGTYVKVYVYLYLIRKLNDMNHREALEHEEEYYTRVVVFKCHLNSSQYYGVHHLAIYAAKCFKGTRSQFDEHLDKYFKGKNVQPYLVYTKQDEIDNVEHAGADRNIKRIPISDGSKRKESYKYLKSGY